MNHCINNQIENQLGLGVLVTLKAISAKDFRWKLLQMCLSVVSDRKATSYNFSEESDLKNLDFYSIFHHKVNNRTTFGFELKFALTLVLRLRITADGCATAVRYPLLSTYPLGPTLAA